MGKHPKGIVAVITLLVAAGFGAWSMMTEEQPTPSTAPPPALSAPATNSSSAAPTATTATNAAAAATTPAATVAATSQPSTNAPQTTTMASSSPEPETMTFRRMATETGGDSAEACLLFSLPLDATGKTRYADYIRFNDKGVRAGFRVDNKRLCISGLAFGTDYSIEILAGMPAANKKQLKENVETVVGFGDREASVTMNAGFILPRENSEGLPITTINIDKLDVKIFRVGDRLLSQIRTSLLDERTLYSYRLNEVGDETGAKIWSGTVETPGLRNQQTVTLVPLAEKIGKIQPGAYLVVARDLRLSEKAQSSSGDGEEDDYDYDYGPRWAAQWMVQSDLGLTYFEGADGLTIVVRSLATAKPVANTELTLIARNNEELGKVKTNADGVASFPAGLLRGAGGMTATMVMAYGGSDFNFLDLRRSKFDLSDRGVSGRDPAGAVDAFLYTERGIYRPGENVHLVSMLRDPAADALGNQTITIKIFRPDGKEARRFTVESKNAGGSYVNVPLPASAARGTWTASAFVDPEGSSVGSVSFEVQDFVPQRLALDVTKNIDVLRPGNNLTLSIDARFLYGAPAAGLRGEGEILLTPDPAPYPDFKGYRWGIEGEKFSSDRVALEVPDTDDEGHTNINVGLSWARVQSSLPLRAEVSLGIMEPGGRATSTFLTLPVRLNNVALGIKPRFDSYAKHGQDAIFDVIALNGEGKRIALSDLDYAIYEDVSTWQWFRSGSRWSYQRITREREIAVGKLDVPAADPAALARTFDWGRYRLEIKDRKSGAISSLSFYSGWYGDASSDRPDRLKLAADQLGYKAGDTAKLHIDSDKAGEALLVIANERVHEVRQISVAAGGADISVKMKPEWGAGVYALVTLYHPLGDVSGHEPVRAVGAAWLGLDPAERTLSIAINAPEKIDPRQKITVPVAVSGTSGSAFVTLAAVDQGILQLTNFKTPQPQKYYFSKRRLGVEMRDDYGRLIRGLPTQADDQGGDGVGGAGLEVVPTRTVALFSGIVALDVNGRAEIPLDIPEFQGELRLMAIAWDAKKVGSTDKRMTVRDPVVAEVILPRFLAPDDHGMGTVLVHNVDGKPGDYTIEITTKGAIAGKSDARILTLPTGKREIYTFPITGKTSGIGGVDLSVSGPGFKVAKDWPIQVRPAQLPETREIVRSIAPGGQDVLKSDLLQSFVPGTGKAAVSFSRWQGMDAPGLLRWLDRYPYGCLEQTTSRALPLLYFNDVAAMTGLKKDENIEDRVQDAIDKVLSQQTETGAFRMWGGNWGDEAYPWLSVFTLDFLFRAREKGFDVPMAPLNLGKRWLTGNAMRNGDVMTRAYAYAVLARVGQVNVSDLRYFYDQNRPKNPLALAQLGSALEATGERARANEAFTLAREGLERWSKLAFAAEGSWRANPTKEQISAARELARYETGSYGSLLRDTFGVVVEMASSGRSGQVPSLLTMAGAYDMRADHTTTQEKAWMLLAIADMAKNSGQLAVEIDGVKTDKGDPISVSLTEAMLEKGVTVKNRGEGEIFEVLSTQGAPIAPLPASQNGIQLRKQVYTLDGGDVDLTKVTRNDRLIVVVNGTATSRTAGEYALLDLLPAGWDIEATLRPGQPGYEWIGTLSEAQTREARDDRMIAVVKLPNDDNNRYYYDDEEDKRPQWNNEWEFRVAYVVRAVTPGEFTLPAAMMEHMYSPRIRSRTELDHLSIVERK